MRLMIAMKVPL